MKSTLKETGWKVRIVLLYALLGLTSLTAFATNESEKIFLEGQWMPYGRSIIQMPISASICNSVISIINSRPDRDVSVSIINKEGIIVYKQEIPQSETASIVINVDDLTEGEYILEISSSGGGLLCGSFKYR